MKTIKFLSILSMFVFSSAFAAKCGDVSDLGGISVAEGGASRSLCNISEQTIKAIASTDSSKAEKMATAFNEARKGCTCEGDLGQGDDENASSHCSSPRSIKYTKDGDSYKLKSDYINAIGN